MIVQTSLESYWEVKRDSRLGERYEMILDLLRRGSAMTDYEIAKALSYNDPNSVRPRRNELVKYGYVHSIGKRKCTITQKKATTWRIVC